MIAVLASVIISGFVSASIVRMNSSMFKGLASSGISLQAQQYAESEATILRCTEYESLTAHAKNEIAGSNGYLSEVVLSDESELGNGIKQRSAVINIYKDAEALPRVSLRVVRSSIEKSSGVPIGTIITWPFNTAPNKDGVWLLCNGASFNTTLYPELAALCGSVLPNLTDGRFLEGSSSAGVVHEAGLPNITGKICGGWMSGYGVFANADFVNVSGDGHGRPPSDSCFFDASRCSSIYGKSETVQPKSYTVRYYIKAAD